MAGILTLLLLFLLTSIHPCVRVCQETKQEAQIVPIREMAIHGHPLLCQSTWHI